MKKQFKIIIVLAVFLLAFTTISAQKKNTIPTKGFWELVSSTHSNAQTIVQYYDDNSNLIYQEKVTGVKFNLKRRKTLIRLKEGLEKAIIAWHEKSGNNSSSLVAELFKK